MENVRPHYALLRIAPEATQAEIEEAYQRLVSYLREKIAAGRQPPQEEFERLHAAFAVLRDPARRAAYDKTPPESSPTTPATPSHALPAAPPSIPRSPAAPTADAAASPRALPFAFRGDGGEYFRIWIVNLLLSIVTLGIYSAWAKVRREQYFHRNLILDDAGFDYHGNPVAILKGRIVALVLFAAVSASQHVSLTLYLAALAAGAFVFPWLIMRSLRFRAHNSSYRGLRFSFVGTYGGALKAYVGYGLVVLVTFGLGTPVWLRETHKYILNNLRYGHGEFHCELLAAEIFGFMFKAWLIAIAALVTAMFAFAFLGVMLPKLAVVTSIVSVFASLFVYIALLPYLRMALNNYVWSRTSFDDNDFSSNMQFKAYFGITLKNWLFTLLTLGLYWPWAKVNLTRYRASCTGLAMAGSLDSFMASASQQVGAFGDAATDVFDFDIAI